MAALGSCDDSVRANHHVAVKIHVHLQGCQNHKIQLIDHGPFVEGVGIGSCRYAEML